MHNNNKKTKAFLSLKVLALLFLRTLNVCIRIISGALASGRPISDHCVCILVFSNANGLIGSSLAG